MSHHSNDYDPEMLEALRMAEPIKDFNEKMSKLQEQFTNTAQRLGPTGGFPHGKLTKHDEGEIAFAVGEKDGKVVIDFNSPVHWLGMTPDQACDLGRLLIKRGRKLQR